MKISHEIPGYAVQLFEPEAGAVYPIEVAAHIAQVPRRTILLYCKHGLVSPLADPHRNGYYFSEEAIRTLRYIEYLRAKHDINISGIKIIIHLMREMEYMRSMRAFPKRNLRQIVVWLTEQF
jgi:DNA-binding transcriptional MerR regulator